MATKEDSIQEEQVQKPTAAGVEPRAANLIIPRRDLLTGAALVLVGSASGCDGNPQPVRTQFMADFTAAFIGDPTKIKSPGTTDPWPDPSRLWPTTGQTRNDVATDYATFLNVLMTVGYVKGPPPTYPSGSLGDRIGKFLVTQNWPAGTAVPPAYQGQRPTVHLLEIAVIQDRLLQAINSFGSGSGGGGSDWPPH